MADLYDFYDVNDNTNYPIYGLTSGKWQAQSYTTTDGYTIESVDLLIYKGVGADPWDLIISIQGMDGGGPDGVDIDGVTGIIDAGALTEDTAGLWYKITFDSGIILDPTTQYAIVARTTNPNTGHRVHWRAEYGNPPGYAGGSRWESNNGGVNWTVVSTVDFMFRCYGASAVPPVEGSGSVAIITTLSGAGKVSKTVKGTGTCNIVTTISSSGVSIAPLTGGFYKENNKKGYLNSRVLLSDTRITLQDIDYGGGSKDRNIPLMATQIMRLVIWGIQYPNPSVAPDREIVSAIWTGFGQIFDIIRAQEGTEAHDHYVGDNIALLLTAEMTREILVFEDFENSPAGSIAYTEDTDDDGNMEVLTLLPDDEVSISTVIVPPPPYCDNYSGPADSFLTLDSPGKWAGQSFTTTFKYNLEHVDLWIKKGPGANVGNVTVELYAVDGSGHPTGPPLNWGVIPNANVSEDYSWVSCTLGNGELTYYLLSAATKYCLVVHGVALNGIGDELIWACGGDGSDYPNGDQEWSTDGGSIWTTDTTKDQLFRCYSPDFLDNYAGSGAPFFSLDLNSANDWGGQSFTAMKSYTLNRVDMWFKKDIGDFVGDILFELYAVDEFGHPDIMAGTLATGTLSDADVPTDYAWVPCSMSGYNVVIDTKYCIVVHGFSLNAGNLIRLAYDDSLGFSGYAGGALEWSTDGGGAWNTWTSDLLFRCYGIVPPIAEEIIEIVEEFKKILVSGGVGEPPYWQFIWADEVGGVKRV